jgi:hypothetical protein
MPEFAEFRPFHQPRKLKYRTMRSASRATITALRRWQQWRVR